MARGIAFVINAPFVVHYLLFKKIQILKQVSYKFRRNFPEFAEPFQVSTLGESLRSFDFVGKATGTNLPLKPQQYGGIHCLEYGNSRREFMGYVVMSLIQKSRASARAEGCDWSKVWFTYWYLAVLANGPPTSSQELMTSFVATVYLSFYRSLRSSLRCLFLLRMFVLYLSCGIGKLSFCVSVVMFAPYVVHIMLLIILYFQFPASKHQSTK